MTLRRLLPIFALAVSLAISAPAQTNNQGPAQSSAAAAAAYPDTPEGLQKQLEDILLAYRDGDTEKAQRLINNFCVPDPAAASRNAIHGSAVTSSLSSP